MQVIMLCLCKNGNYFGHWFCKSILSISMWMITGHFHATFHFCLKALGKSFFKRLKVGLDFFLHFRSLPSGVVGDLVPVHRITTWESFSFLHVFPHPTTYTVVPGTTLPRTTLKTSLVSWCYVINVRRCAYHFITSQYFCSSFHNFKYSIQKSLYNTLHCFNFLPWFF